MKVTFVIYDSETDGVAVKHDGEVVWTESSFDRIGQYLRFGAPIGEPVEIAWEVLEGGEVVDRSPGS